MRSIIERGKDKYMEEKEKPEDLDTNEIPPEDNSAEVAALKELLTETNKTLKELAKQNEELKKANFKLAMTAEQTHQSKTVDECLLGIFGKRG